MATINHHSSAPGIRGTKPKQIENLKPVKTESLEAPKDKLVLGAAVLLGIAALGGAAQAAPATPPTQVSLQKDTVTTGKTKEEHQGIEEAIKEKLDEQIQEAQTQPEDEQVTSGRTALQKQVDFFDANQNGEITLGETYRGMRSIGVGRGKAVAVSLITNGAFGYASGSPWYKPLTVQTESIHLAKHGGDTDVYNQDGLFDAERFEGIFDFDTDGDQAISQSELEAMLESRKDGDAFGARASAAGFGLLMDIAGQDQGGERVLTRETLTEFYQGTLFYRLSGRTNPN